MWIIEDLDHRNSKDKRYLNWMGRIPGHYDNGFNFSLKNDYWDSDHDDNWSTLNVEFECVNEVVALRDQLNNLLSHIESLNKKNFNN